MSHYKPYPAYRDSGVEWIGRVPEHWSVCKLNFRFSVELGKMLDQKRISGEHLIPYLRNQDVQWGAINSAELPMMDIAPDEYERYTAVAGDLLVCEGGDVGRAAIWHGEPIGYQKALHRLRPRGNDYTPFMLALMIAARAKGVFSEADTKSTISHLPAEAFRTYRFPFPPEDEQTAIVAALDRETARIDALIAKKARFIELLKEKRQARITHAVTKGLDPTVKMKDSGVEWIGEVPAHWDVKRIKFATVSSRNGVWGDDPTGKDDTPCVRVADFDRDAFRVKAEIPTLRAIPEKDRASRLLRRGNLLLEKSGGGENQPVGQVVLYDRDDEAVCSNFIARIELGLQAEPSFWCYQFAATYTCRLNLRSVKQTSGIQNLDQEQYFDEAATYPPPLEQATISAALDSRIASIDALIAKVSGSITLLKERRSALITAAVTGQIDLRNEPEAA